jgi:hypothetical protein
MAAGHSVAVPSLGAVGGGRTGRKMRGLKRVLMMFVASLLAIFVLLTAWGWKVAITGDIPPAGPTCGWEADHGSGAAGVGHEEIAWGVLPERVCMPDGIDAGRRPSGDLAGSQSFLVGSLLALVLGPLIVVVVVHVVDRRSGNRQASIATPSARKEQTTAD